MLVCLRNYSKFPKDVFFINLKDPSVRMTNSISGEHHYCNNSWKTDSIEAGRSSCQLVAHTVAERRARAEALEIERIRACRAKLEASEAALEAARQRAHSLREARISELRSRDEERRAKVMARRKRLEEVKLLSFMLPSHSLLLSSLNIKNYFSIVGKESATGSVHL